MFLGVVVTPVVFFMFAIEYTGRKKLAHKFSIDSYIRSTHPDNNRDLDKRRT